MKKSLLAVAVAAALPAFAQAQSSVTLFGILDASVEYSDAQANASVIGGTLQEGDAGLRLNSGHQSGSRFGVRGTEDLGGGLRAIFTIEHRLDISTGDTQGGQIFLIPGATNAATNNKFWNGQAWVGLSGGWGQLTAGRQYSPIFWSAIPSDFTGYGFYNNWAAFSGTNLGGATTQGAFRIDNSLAYKSPTFGGLTVYAMYAFGENLTNSATTGADVVGTGDMMGIAAGWQLGGLYLSAGFHSFDVKQFTGATVANVEDVMLVSATYKFTNFGLSVGYSNINIALATSTPAISNILFSAFANIGPGTLFINGAIAESSDFPAATARNDSGLQLGVAYSMPISKRTNWYVSYGLNDATPLQPAGARLEIDSQNRFSVGVRHLF
jgi:predicted porin